MIFKKNKLLRNFIYIKLKLLFIKKNNWKKFTLFFKLLKGILDFLFFIKSTIT